MRLKSGIWAAAFLRRTMVEGLYGAVIKRGAEEAGAIFVMIDHRDGTCHVFGAPPGPAYDEEGERRWIVELAPPATPADAKLLLDRKQRFDPDIWILEIDDPKGTAGLKAVS